MSSPLDSNITNIKKKKRLAALANKDKENKQSSGFMGVSGCDIGASPLMQGVFQKNARDKNQSPLA